MHPIAAYNPDVQFDTNWAGPSELKPRVYRTQSEKDTWYSVVVEDEYRVPATFAPDDVVIDIGAHIGSVAWLAWKRGSRSIYAFEIDRWHYEAALQNLVEGITHEEIALYHAAVVRSDAHQQKQYYYAGMWNSFSPYGEPVPSISLDQIITDAQAPIRFLKIDCEGGEWPILYTCTKLDQVQEIAGEYHEGAATGPEGENLPYPQTMVALGHFLGMHGFAVCISEQGTVFYARRTVPLITHTAPEIIVPSI